MFKIKNRVLRVLAGLVALGVISTVGLGFVYGMGYLLKLLCLRFFFVAHFFGSSCAGDILSLGFFVLTPLIWIAAILLIAWLIGEMHFRPNA